MVQIPLPVETKAGTTIYEMDISRGWVIHSGARIDPFDVVDASGGKSTLYLHDLDCIRRYRPQLDIIQDLATEVPVWYDGAFRYAEAVIDAIVSGAEAVTVSAAFMRDMSEFERLITLTPSAFIDLKSEHADGIDDLERKVLDRNGISRLVSLGFDTFIGSEKDVDFFEQLRQTKMLHLWLRDGGDGAAVPGSIGIAGRVMQIDELIENE
ncbi:MAG: hypothetical protein QXP70_05590 [Methanomassiliicoccales archaeon]